MSRLFNVFDVFAQNCCLHLKTRIFRPVFESSGFEWHVNPQFKQWTWNIRWQFVRHSIVPAWELLSSFTPIHIFHTDCRDPRRSRGKATFMDSSEFTKGILLKVHYIFMMLRNARWWLFDLIWNGQVVRFWNAILNPNHSTSEQLKTIQNLNMYCILARLYLNLFSKSLSMIEKLFHPALSRSSSFSFSYLPWGSDYQPFENRKHLNTNFFEVQISNGLVFSWVVLCYLIAVQKIVRLICCFL